VTSVAFLWVRPQEWGCWIIWQVYVKIFKKTPNFFPEWLHQLAFPPTVYEGSFFLTSSPKHVVSGVFDDGYSNRGEMES
jgi:hypothetical protein